MTASIRSVTVNPTWTIPRSIIESELIPKLEKNPGYLKRAQIDILDRRHRAINPRLVNWSESDGAGLTFRQQPGAKNSLGRLRIDMPNKEAVYLHDTPSRQLFAHDYRFLSHGCVRVQGVDALAAWILGQSGSGREAWTPERLAAAIKTEDTKQLPVKPTIPVAWVYLDAWADSGGTVHFRGDIYHLDEPQQHPADEASR